MKVIAILFILTAQLLFTVDDVSAATHPSGIRLEKIATDPDAGRTVLIVAQAKPKEGEEEDDDEIDEDDC